MISEFILLALFGIVQTVHLPYICMLCISLEVRWPPGFVDELFFFWNTFRWILLFGFWWMTKSPFKWVVQCQHGSDLGLSVGLILITTPSPSWMFLLVVLFICLKYFCSPTSSLMIQIVQALYVNNYKWILSVWGGAQWVEKWCTVVWWMRLCILFPQKVKLKCKLKDNELWKNAHPCLYCFDCMFCIDLYEFEESGHIFNLDYIYAHLSYLNFFSRVFILFLQCKC